MDQNAKKIGLINWMVLLATTVGLALVSNFASSKAGIVGAVVAAIGFMVAILSYFQMRMEERERFERLEMEELSKSRGGSSLFESADDDTFPAKRSREQFEKYVVPAFTVILFLLQAAAAYLPWKYLETMPAVKMDRAALAMALMGLFALVLFLLGKYSSGLARLEGQRLLRPGANYALLIAYSSFVVVGSLAAILAGFPKFDLLIARILCGVMALIALETLLGLIMEIYRVRVKGREAHVLYESRLVGLLGKPEAIFSTAAHALDYQFGFKVSETWFYRFLERSLPLLVMAQLAILFLCSCMVFIDPGEQALLERLGKPVAGREVLNPGLHFKLPWPVDKVMRYRTEQIQSFVVGSDMGEDHEHVKGPRTVTWTVTHSKEDNLLVASREAVRSGTNNPAKKNSPPVNLLAVGIPVQFQITNLTSWAYVNEAPEELLKRIAMREVVRYLASADLNELMANGREIAGGELRQRIQAAADERQLGARILFAAVEDIHPPVKVAADFEKVIAMTQVKEAKILEAQAYAAKTNAFARAAAFQKENEADSARLQRICAARAMTNLFLNQLQAYNSAPEIYAQRAYLQMMSRSVDGARKYVIATTNTSEVINMNLEDKLRTDLSDLSLPQMSKKDKK